MRLDPVTPDVGEPLPDFETLVQHVLPVAQALAHAGAAAIVDATPADMGRRLEVCRAISQRSGLSVVASTGTYREPWVPAWARVATPEKIAAWMLAEVRDGPCGAIKLGCSPDGPSEAEALCARAAGQVSRATGVFVACHVEQAAAGGRALDAFEQGGGDPTRFAIVHLHEDPDVAGHLALGKRGAWLSYDRVGGRMADDAYTRLVLDQATAGYAAQLLIAQDAPVYFVDQRGNHRVATVERFTHLMTRFLPALRAAGADEALVQQLLVDNPRRALAYSPGASSTLGDTHPA
ncbi:MAG: hypothetical protein AVDCRST_MAG77-6130 [uncultured Chloroflexi bacterium]|uniref:Phosphotriesterase n=1 Tax=uncultured Chloroflexota bacterium TaxID=166587 RepID=A0A6J4KHX9_9CHLR|nr:MAG: hypothetical protein AVDCRST_MAG77-6130 [uncultured Chloroflexota bacterium]